MSPLLLASAFSFGNGAASNAPQPGDVSPLHMNANHHQSYPLPPSFDLRGYGGNEMSHAWQTFNDHQPRLAPPQALGFPTNN